MTRHSKNNTAGAFFTSEERRKLDYGTRVQRLGRDSLRRPDACHVCLQTAQDPVICAEGGHLFCRECILTYIVEQRQQVLAQKKAIQEENTKRKAEEQAGLEEEQRKRIAAFEATQSGKCRPILGAEGDKQKGRPQLNAFWMPSKAPSTSVPTLQTPSKVINCPAAQHPINTKKLISLTWSRGEVEAKCICKLCLREVNSITTGLIVWRGCGHLVCKKCLQQMSGDGRDEKVCLVCDKSSESLMELAMDGTGFAESGGKVTVSKAQPAFY